MAVSNFEKTISQFRKISIVAVIASAFGSLLMFVIGAVKVVKAYHSYFFTEAITGTGPLSGVNVAIAYLVQAIDAFLIALVLMIFGSGVYSLFVRSAAIDPNQPSRPFQISSITELKKILAELIIVILMVKFLEGVLLNSKGAGWEMLVLPVAVLLLAAAVWMLKLDHK